LEHTFDPDDAFDILGETVQGMVILQRSGTSSPNDYANGGEIVYVFNDFRIFDRAVVVDDIDDDSEIRLYSTQSGGNANLIATIALDSSDGASSFDRSTTVYDPAMNIGGVLRMEVDYPSSGAVTSFNLLCGFTQPGVEDDYVTSSMMLV